MLEIILDDYKNKNIRLKKADFVLLEEKMEKRRDTDMDVPFKTDEFLRILDRGRETLNMNWKLALNRFVIAFWENILRPICHAFNLK